MSSIQLSEAEFQYRKREGDGICSLCKEWTMGKAYADTENAYCPSCSNNTLLGVNVAKISKLIEVTQ